MLILVGLIVSEGITAVVYVILTNGESPKIRIVARMKSGSVVLTILLHSFGNLLATARVVIHLRNSTT